MMEEDSGKPQSAPALKTSNPAITEMATELIEQKKANRSMQMELEQLRVQMEELQASYSEQELQLKHSQPQHMSAQQYTQQ